MKLYQLVVTEGLILSVTKKQCAVMQESKPYSSSYISKVNNVRDYLVDFVNYPPLPEQTRKLRYSCHDMAVWRVCSDVNGRTMYQDSKNIVSTV